MLALCLGLCLAAAPALALDNGAGRTPALAWSTWNVFFNAINESLVMDIAEALVSSGLQQLGWEYVNVDAGWAAAARDSGGSLQADPDRFPSGMAALADGIHRLGLKFGLYTDISQGSCAGVSGSYGHYEQDAATFASWQVDYLKVDFCGDFGSDTQPQWAHWAALRDALNATGRSIYYSICPKTDAPDSGTALPYLGQQIYSPPLNWTREQHRHLANSWLVEYVNAVDSFYSEEADHCENAGPPPCGVLTNIDAVVQMTKPAFAQPGAWNDADMLEVSEAQQRCSTAQLRGADASQLTPTAAQVCNLGVHDGGMSFSEYRSMMSVWAVLSSPLILSMDLRQLPHSQRLRDCLQYAVLNKRVVGINQDVHAGRFLGGQLWFSPANATTTAAIEQQIFGKELSGRGWAVVLFNRAASSASMRLHWGMIGWAASVNASVHDVWEGKDRGLFSEEYSAEVESHGVVMITLFPRQVSID